MLSLLHSPTLTSIHDHRKNHSLTRQIFVGKVMSLLFSMLSRLVITFLPRSKRLLISWLQLRGYMMFIPKTGPKFPPMSSTSAFLSLGKFCYQEATTWEILNRDYHELRDPVCPVPHLHLENKLCPSCPADTASRLREKLSLLKLLFWGKALASKTQLQAGLEAWSP